MLVLGLESSCDETSAALLKDNEVIANTIYTQAVHSEYGGVVPEIASRTHIKKIDRLCLSVLEKNGYGPEDLDLIAVTDRPGLAGALLVGISFALGMHTTYKTPIIGVNHLEGHISSVLIENQDLSFPFLSLVVSGGHTAIYKVTDFGQYECIGTTIDDAAGEAFDKIGKMIGFPYPAGRAIEEEANKYAGNDCINFPVARLKTDGIDFSFSGLKTAVKYHLQENAENYLEENRPLLCYSFQQAVIKSFVSNMQRAVEETGINKITLVGGVACNSTIRKALSDKFGGNVFYPSPILCTDNAAMIAKAGLENYSRGERRFPSMSPTGSFKL